MLTDHLFVFIGRSQANLRPLPIIRAIFAITIVLCSNNFISIAMADPRPGQTLTEFESEVTSDLAMHGDKMGFYAWPCNLKPSFDPLGKIYYSRAFSQRDDTVIALISVRDGKVYRWQEFDLPKITGWITHMSTMCKGSLFLVDKGDNFQRFRWNGKFFFKIQ